MENLRPSPSRHTTGQETRALLIDAATQVFLDDGFKAARVQDIADRAGIRISAINYHFGGKQGLYLAVLQHHAELAISRHPVVPAEPNQSPQARFEFLVRGLVSRLLDSSHASRIGPLMLREISNPTPALDFVFERFSRPQGQILLALLQEILGQDTPPAVLMRCLFSVLGQCVIYVAGRGLVERFQPGFYDDPALIDELSRHVATFSWAGLMATARQLGEKT